MIMVTTQTSKEELCYIIGKPIISAVTANGSGNPILFITVAGEITSFSLHLQKFLNQHSINRSSLTQVENSNDLAIGELVQTIG